MRNLLAGLASLLLVGCWGPEEPQDTVEADASPDEDSDAGLPKTIYHGVTPRSWGSWVTPPPGQADAIAAEVDAYEAAVGRPVAFVAFAHEWDRDGRAFPIAIAASIRDRGAVPLIYLNLRSDDPSDGVYSLSAILAGAFDADFEAWADGATAFGTQLIVDWGWEMNSAWGDSTSDDPWDGALNGGDPDGPARFRDAYRHVVELMRGRGADNLVFAFHVNVPDAPAESWNAFESYYPGDDVVDLTGVSIYGAGTPTDDAFPDFVSQMDDAYARLVELAPEKPVFVFELGATMGNPFGDPVTWADDALAGLLSGRWPAVGGFAWWNDAWTNDEDPAHDTEMRVEVVPGLAEVFAVRLSGANNLGDRPPIRW